MSGRRLLDDCVHCGFCLPACPTYQSWGHEADSPRGRIDLLKGLADGKLEWDGTVALHLDRCLGCMACVTACPSGVRYDVLIEEARARREREVPRPVVQGSFRRLVFALLPHPRRLKALLVPLLLLEKSGLLAFARRHGLVPKRLAPLDELAPPLSWGQLTASLPAFTPASGARRARVGVLSGCVQKVFFPSVNQATVRVLAAEGCDVVVPRGQGCCGALSLHAGREDEARAMARALIPLFEREGLDFVAVNAAGCGSALKEYGRLLADDPVWAERAAAFAAKVRDVTELLAALGPSAPRHELKARAAFHDACHVAHAQGVRSQPRTLLAGIPGLTLLEVPDGDQCCGSAGIYNLVEPESAAEIGARKAANVLSTGADLLVSANPGCTLQIGRHARAQGRELAAFHPVELLDASISGRPLPGRGEGPR